MALLDETIRLAQTTGVNIDTALIVPANTGADWGELSGSNNRSPKRSACLRA
jgi:hypothetical protein